MYEGRNGWWLYDERTSQEIEKSFKKSDQRCELLIAGFLYIIGKYKTFHLHYFNGRIHGARIHEVSSIEIAMMISCVLLIREVFRSPSDFEHMLQYRRNDPSRRRKIKRDLASAPKKGVAGLRMDAASEETEDLSAALDTLNIGSDQPENPQDQS